MTKEQQTPSDEDLIRRYYRGEPSATEAFEVLYTRYRRKLLQFFAANRIDQEDAVDIVQETFFKVACSRDKNRFNSERGTFKTWLFTIARRLAIDYQRRRYRHVPNSSIERED